MLPVFANTGTIGGGHPSLRQGGNRDNASCVSGRLGTDHRTGSRAGVQPRFRPDPEGCTRGIVW